MVNTKIKKILVTGATGFLGGALARRLGEMGKNCEVVVTGRNEERGRTLQDRFATLRFVRGDLEDRDFMKGLCSGVQRVFHCGALSSPWGSREAFENANVRGTENIVAGCKEHNVERLIYVSSPSVYPQANDALMVKEDTPLNGNPLNEYIATKRQAEVLIEEARGTLNVVTLRPRALFGPEDETLFPRILRAARKGRFPLMGSSDPWMDCTYIDNAVDALLLASGAPSECNGRIYNVTNGEPMRRSELFERLFSEVGLPYSPRVIPLWMANTLAVGMELGSRFFTGGNYEPVLTRYTVNVLAKSQTLDISAARSALGYEPNVSVSDGLKRFGVWWKQRQAVEGK